jgi:hypothetical protein
MFPNLNGSLLSIDDLRIDPSNPSCLSNPTGIINLHHQIFLINYF